MTKTKKRTNKTSRTKSTLIAAVAVLVAVAAALLFMTQGKKQDMTHSVYTSLGPIEYRIEDGKAVKRTDSAATELRAFLDRRGENSGCHTDAYNQVVVASDDEKQILLRYGCSAPTSNMFAVKHEGEWQTISPTNQFDLFGIPRCSHVDEHNIDTSVAPVCVSGYGEEPLDEHEYIVR